MEVTKIVINGIEITTFDKPIGLEVNKLSLDRDFQYSCIDTKIEAELKFYCASGKEQLDAEYESKGVEGSGYVEIVDECGTNAQTYRFNLDFKKYNNQGDYTTVGLIDVNSLWKQDLNKEININTLSGDPADFYIRNLPLIYEYYSENIEQSEDIANGYLQDFGAGAAYILLSVYPKVNTKINELEESNVLNSEFSIITDITIAGTSYIELDNNISFTAANGVQMSTILVLPPDYFRIPNIEPQPIFENKLDLGDFFIETFGDTAPNITFSKNYELNFRFLEFREVCLTGFEWGKFTYNSSTPFRPLKGFMQSNYVVPGTPVVISASNPIPNAAATVNFNLNGASPSSSIYTFPLEKGEKVWIFYQFRLDDNAGTLNLKMNEWSFTLDRYYNINFTLTKNTINTLSSAADIVPYHTLTKAYQGAGLLNSVFGIDYNISNTPCFEDLWFTRGDYLRGKINVADFIVKPSDFFRELEKVVCCGLGYFYDTNSAGDRRLMSVYDFYSDTLVPSQYQFDYDDLIDGKIELTPFLSPYYKEIQIGYTTSKDSPKELCKQNTYSIDNISESNYSKISDFVASQYIITQAVRLGTEDKKLEFDDNIFLFSGGSVVSGVTTYNATLSQPSGILTDDIEVSPYDLSGINRRYATVFNLFRHLYKWGFSLFADKFKLQASKYEGNSIYDYDIKDLSGEHVRAYYHGLSECMLPYDNFAKVDKSIEDIYTDFIQSGLYVPTQITFKTANLSSLDLIAMRAHQYDLFSVTDGTNIYYGNLISANSEDDVTEIKLLRRFKNGLTP